MSNPAAPSSLEVLVHSVLWQALDTNGLFCLRDAKWIDQHVEKVVHLTQTICSRLAKPDVGMTNLDLLTTAITCPTTTLHIKDVIVNSGVSVSICESLLHAISSLRFLPVRT